MSPLSIVKYVVEHLQESVYAPFVDMLLFLLFVTAVLACVRFLIGGEARKAISRCVSTATQKLRARHGYAPAWEKKRARMEPYVDLVASAYFAFVGLYGAVTIFVLAMLARHQVPWWALMVSGICSIACLIYMRINLEAVSWAHHKIKVLRNS
jgi:hypothetical protein